VRIFNSIESYQLSDVLWERVWWGKGESIFDKRDKPALGLDGVCDFAPEPIPWLAASLQGTRSKNDQAARSILDFPENTVVEVIAAKVFHVQKHGPAVLLQFGSQQPSRVGTALAPVTDKHATMSFSSRQVRERLRFIHRPDDFRVLLAA